jgi:outer membrane protein OmpA-like peptidoglycan-associated protein
MGAQSSQIAFQPEHTPHHRHHNRGKGGAQAEVVQVQPAAKKYQVSAAEEAEAGAEAGAATEVSYRPRASDILNSKAFRDDRGKGERGSGGAGMSFDLPQPKKPHPAGQENEGEKECNWGTWRAGGLPAALHPPAIPVFSGYRESEAADFAEWRAAGPTLTPAAVPERGWPRGWEVSNRVTLPAEKDEFGQPSPYGGVSTLTLYDPKTGKMCKLIEGAPESKRAAAAAAAAARSVAWIVAQEDSRRCCRLLRKDMALLIHSKLPNIWEEIAKARLRRMQDKVNELMEHSVSHIHCDLITVDLASNQIRMNEEIQFVPGKTEIKSHSWTLLNQIVCALNAVEDACDLYKEPQLHWSVEGHTAPSDKDDSGMGTSLQRSRAVCGYLKEHEINADILHPKGHGCFRAPPAGKDPRRVEIHAQSALQRRGSASYAQLTSSKLSGLARLRTVVSCTQFERKIAVSRRGA